jgi:hypothetical protein
LQKNERALNCLSALRLYETEHVLNVPDVHIFEGIQGPIALARPAKKLEKSSIRIQDEASKHETIELVRAYYAITDRRLREQMSNTMRALARALTARSSTGLRVTPAPASLIE